MEKSGFIERRSTYIVDQHRIFGSAVHGFLGNVRGVYQKRTCSGAPDFRQMRLARSGRPGKDRDRRQPVRPAIDKIDSGTVGARDDHVFPMITGLMLKIQRNLARCLTHRGLLQIPFQTLPGYDPISFLFACILACLDQRPGVGVWLMVGRIIHR